jgi:TPR repeat protein
MKKIVLAVLLTYGLGFSLLPSIAFAGIEEGNAAYKKGDFPTALREFKPLAAQGNADAQYSLGVMYDRGEGVAQDHARAHMWWSRAAAQGDSWAQGNLGQQYRKGEGVVQDYAEAVKWYKLAAAQGSFLGQIHLGFMYDRGEGVAQDYVRAHMWLNLAATSGGGWAMESRDNVAKKMTSEQIGEAQKMARECQKRNFKGCD